MCEIAGRLTTKAAVGWFETGVRVSQALHLWANTKVDIESVDEALRIAGLNRLLRALRQHGSSLVATNLPSLLRRFSGIIAERPLPTESLAEIRILLSETQAELDWHCSHHEVRITQLAWEFGLAIADSEDRTWSEGTPTIVDDSNSDTKRIKIAFLEARLPYWSWRNESKVLELGTVRK